MSQTAIIDEPREHFRDGSVGGVDQYTVQRTARSIMRALSAAGWSKGEANMLPKYLEQMMEKNQKRISDAEPFLVYEDQR